MSLLRGAVPNLDGFHMEPRRNESFRGVDVLNANQKGSAQVGGSTSD